ncbi:MAG: hypothetical protein PHD76_03625 [Methylacidiphilales bacterium]|nr:hypothetical protein [Candidatus Methylacidiphilales bacterium]
MPSTQRRYAARVMADGEKQMITRIITGWITIAGSGVVSFFLFALSRWLDYPLAKLTGGKPLPVISTLFYPPTVWPYLFPVIFVLFAIYATARCRSVESTWTALCVLTLITTLMFVAIFLFSMALPWLPMRIYPIQVQ